MFPIPPSQPFASFPEGQLNRSNPNNQVLPATTSLFPAGDWLNITFNNNALVINGFRLILPQATARGVLKFICTYTWFEEWDQFIKNIGLKHADLTEVNGLSSCDGYFICCFGSHPFSFSSISSVEDVPGGWSVPSCFISSNDRFLLAFLVLLNYGKTHVFTASSNLLTSQMESNRQNFLQFLNQFILFLKLKNDEKWVFQFPENLRSQFPIMGEGCIHNFTFSVSRQLALNLTTLLRFYGLRIEHHNVETSQQLTLITDEMEEDRSLLNVLIRCHVNNNLRFSYQIPLRSLQHSYNEVEHRLATLNDPSFYQAIKKIFEFFLYTAQTDFRLIQNRESRDTTNKIRQCLRNFGNLLSMEHALLPPVWQANSSSCLIMENLRQRLKASFPSDVLNLVRSINTFIGGYPAKNKQPSLGFIKIPNESILAQKTMQDILTETATPFHSQAAQPPVVLIDDPLDDFLTNSAITEDRNPDIQTNDAITANKLSLSVTEVQQAVSPQLVQSQLYPLSTLVEKHYGSTIPHLMRFVMIAQKGAWGIDFADQKLMQDVIKRGGSKEVLLKPFYDFLSQPKATRLERQATLEAVREICLFFRFTDSDRQGQSDNIFTDYENGSNDPLCSAQCVDLILKQTPSSTTTFLPLSDVAISDVQQKFISLKLHELRLLTTHYVQLSHLSSPPSIIPCFLLTQNTRTIHTRPMTAYFDGKGRLDGLGSEQNNITTPFLLQALGEDCPTSSSSEGIFALNLKQLGALRTYVQQTPSNSRLPLALIMDREDSVQPIHSQELKRKRSLAEKDEIRGSEKRLHTDYKNPYKPLDQEVIEIDLTFLPPKKSNGELPIIANPKGISGENPWLGNIDPHNFWNQHIELSLSKIESKVKREVTKEAVIEQIRPLDYPILEELSNLPEKSKILPLCRSLKTYQINAVAEMLRFRAKGLSQLLALEMGLGKTPTFVEFIAQILSESDKPQLHIVAAPVSLLLQLQREFSEFLKEASATAWQVTGKKGEAQTEIYLKLFQSSINFRNCDSKDFGRFLRVMADFPNAKDRVLRAYEAFVDTEGILNRAIKLLADHFAEIHSLEAAYQGYTQFFEQRVAHWCHYLRLPESIRRPNAALIQYISEQTRGSREAIFTACRLIGYILDESPTRTGIDQNYALLSDSSLQNLRNLGFASRSPQGNHAYSHVVVARKAETLLKKLQSANSSFIAVVAHDDLSKYVEILPHIRATHTIGSVVIDEASKIHTPGTQTCQEIAGALKQFKLHFEEGNNSILFVTGTPFENDIAELWTLLKMSNGEQMFSDLTFSSLIERLLYEIKRQVTDPLKINPDTSDGTVENLVVKSFAQFIHLRELLQKLIYRIKKEDTEVKIAWGGRFPTVNYRDINCIVPEKLISELNQIAKQSKLLGNKDKVEPRLMHPSLAGKLTQQKEKYNFPFLDPLRKKSFLSIEAKIRWIAESYYLRPILNDPSFIARMQNNQKLIILVDRIYKAKAFKKAAKFLYGNLLLRQNVEHRPRYNVFIYSGNENTQARDRIIQLFKATQANRPAILILMEKVGGVGLNLPEADSIFSTLNSWNPATEAQAFARVLRANHEGEKEIVRLNFPGVYVTEHPRTIQAIKRSWEAFLWANPPTLIESLHLWIELLQTEVFRDYLNQLKSVQQAEDKLTSVKEFFKYCLETCSEERLKEVVQRAKPQVKAVERTLGAG